jgi:tetratricopeptide (TPR) repeat protein
LLGFAIALIIFWGMSIWKFKKQIFRPFLILNSSFLILAVLIGTQWTPGINDLIGKSTNKQVATNTGTTVLETGGTESGSIRKIVWKGALQIWLHYPIFGTGVETFAHSYYLYRPAEHNITSEWDFIYNKAHNEYLNFLANTGIVGFLSYLTLIGFSIYQMVKMPNKYQSQINTNVQSEKLGIGNLELIIIGLLSGYASILVTNFFGFSVVPIQLEFFIFPAMAVGFTSNEELKVKSEKVFVSSNQKIVIGSLLLFTFYLLLSISRYWQADYFYSLGKSYNAAGRPDTATKYLSKSIDLQPKEPLYYSELASSYANLALALDPQKEATEVAKLTNAAIVEIDRAINLSPANVTYKRVQFGVFVMLASLNPNYLINARETIISAIAQAPTDAKLYYNLALIYARTGQPELARQTLAKTIELKSNYRDARLAYALLLMDNKQNVEAKTQLEYILNNISPEDSLTKQTLESIK